MGLDALSAFPKWENASGRCFSWSVEHYGLLLNAHLISANLICEKGFLIISMYLVLISNYFEYLIKSIGCIFILLLCSFIDLKT